MPSDLQFFVYDIVNAQQSALSGDRYPPARLTSQDAQITAVATSYVPLEDPLRLLAADFIRRIQRPQISPHDYECLLQNVRLVQQVYEAVQHSQCFRVS
jgi:hypothetical protein